ncbi:hypothetical protein DFH07DRAFT_1054659 [Mycena maculata]|uniref:Uncharacterized protein n=1 Tax=Mycena maculata TaxID=230809 RepID=A0AAD7P280_9AGAR|nr:hypothetical protein DFH07DRAFT_1054659 [Mycena maculata]
MPVTKRKQTFVHPITGTRINLYTTGTTREDRGVPDVCRTCGKTAKELGKQTPPIMLMCCTRCKSNGDIRILYCSKDCQIIGYKRRKPPNQPPHKLVRENTRRAAGGVPSRRQRRAGSREDQAIYQYADDCVAGAGRVPCEQRLGALRLPPTQQREIRRAPDSRDGRRAIPADAPRGDGAPGAREHCAHGKAPRHVHAPHRPIQSGRLRAAARERVRGRPGGVPSRARAKRPPPFAVRRVVAVDDPTHSG